MARLERALGLRLLHRTSRETELTVAGRALLGPAQALLDQAGAFVAEAARLTEPDSSAIRLAYAPMVGGLAARAARRLAQRKPSIDIQLCPAGWRTATEELTQGRVSAAIMATPFPPGFSSTARFHVPVTHVAVPAGDPLARAKAVSTHQLFKYELLIPAPLWQAAQFRPASPRLTCIDDDLHAGLDQVAAGLGLLGVPRLVADTTRRPDVTFVPWKDAQLRFTFGLVWSPVRANAEVMATLQAVQEMLRSAP